MGLLTSAVTRQALSTTSADGNSLGEVRLTAVTELGLKRGLTEKAMLALSWDAPQLLAHLIILAVGPTAGI